MYLQFKAHSHPRNKSRREASLTDTCVVNRNKKRGFVEQREKWQLILWMVSVLTRSWHLKEIAFIGCQLKKKKRKETRGKISWMSTREKIDQHGTGFVSWLGQGQSRMNSRSHQSKWLSRLPAILLRSGGAFSVLRKQSRCEVGWTRHEQTAGTTGTSRNPGPPPLCRTMMIP